MRPGNTTAIYALVRGTKEMNSKHKSVIKGMGGREESLGRLACKEREVLYKQEKNHYHESLIG